MQLKKWIEFVILFLVLPFAFYFDWISGYWKFLPILGFFGYIIAIMIRHKMVRKVDFYIKGIANWQWIKLCIFPIILAIILYTMDPENIIADFSNPQVLIAVISYPVFSSLPQELIYRKFFFTRYSSVFKNKIALILINGVVFSLAHVYFHNWVAISLTFLGGLAFSYSYFKTRSLLFTAIEHSIYGLALLSSGLNPYFYKAFG